MNMPSPVPVATDLSELADEALRQGHAVALAWDVPLVVCHVLPESFRVRVLFPQDAGVDTPHQATLEVKARDIVRTRVEAVLPSRPDVAIEIESGSPHAGIIEIAERRHAGLVVLGPGRTAQRVAQAAACPVLVARQSATAGPVIGASDFSDAALPALHAAAAAERWMGGGLRLMHCLDVDHAVTMAGGAAGGIALPMITDAAFEELRAEAEATLATALASLGTTGEIAVLRRPPGSGIVEEATATGASLVVVGTRGRTGLHRLLMGSTAEQVMSLAPCSVLVVPLDRPLDGAVVETALVAEGVAGVPPSRGAGSVR